MSEIEGRLPVRFSFIAERVESKWVPWQIDEDESVVLESGNDYPIQDDVSLFETGTWPLTMEKNAKVGDRFKVAGDVLIVFSKSWTDCGYEYDADYEGELSFTLLPAPTPSASGRDEG